MSSKANSLDQRFLAQQKERLMDLNKILKNTLVARDTEQSRIRSQSLGETKESEDDAEKLATLESDDILASRSAQRMLPFERALKKIKDGAYGFSDASSKSMPRDRLEAMPESLLTLAEEIAGDAKGASYAGLQN